MTKKWKCISISPPERCTSTADDDSRPRAAAMVRTRRGSPRMLAMAAAVGTTRLSARLWTSEKPMVRATIGIDGRVEPEQDHHAPMPTDP